MQPIFYYWCSSSFNLFTLFPSLNLYFNFIWKKYLKFTAPFKPTPGLSPFLSRRGEGVWGWGGVTYLFVWNLWSFFSWKNNSKSPSIRKTTKEAAYSFMLEKNILNELNRFLSKQRNITINDVSLMHRLRGTTALMVQVLMILVYVKQGIN